MQGSFGSSTRPIANSMTGFVVCAVMITGTVRPFSSSANSENKPPSTPQSASAATDRVARKLVAADHAVISVTLRHFAARHSTQFYKAKPRVLLDVISPGRISNAMDIKFRDYESMKSWKPPLELRLSLGTRNVRKISFAALKNRDKVIFVDELNKYRRKDRMGYDFSEKVAASATKRKDLQIQGYVLMYLPGYSRDGNSALVHFLNGPSMHGGGFASYLLRKKSGRWTVERESSWAYV